MAPARRREPSRAADRLARNLLHSVDPDVVTRAMNEVGLRSLSPTP